MWARSTGPDAAAGPAAYPPAAFLKQHWRKCALGAWRRQRFAALIRERLHGLSVAKLVADSPSEEIHVWFRTAAGNESMKTLTVAGPHLPPSGRRCTSAPADASELLVTALSQQLGLSFGALYPDGAPRSGYTAPAPPTHTHASTTAAAANHPPRPLSPSTSTTISTITRWRPRLSSGPRDRLALRLHGELHAAVKGGGGGSSTLTLT